MPSEKILVCGNVEGKFVQLYKRISQVNKKSGPFSILLCTGSFFGEDASEWLPFKTGKLKFPIPIYVLGPCSEELASHFPDLRGCELAENVIYLGPSGVYPCSSGLRIAYLSGLEVPSGLKKTSSTFSFEEVKALETAIGKKGKVDILLTSQWPKGVCNFAKSPDNLDLYGSAFSYYIARLAYLLKPRYHFAAFSGTHYERLPYRNHQVLTESAQNVTRFIALSKVGNIGKQKWLYAFAITPTAHCPVAELLAQPTDVTECPFGKEVMDEPIDYIQKEKKQQGSQFFYDMQFQPEEGSQRGYKRKAQQRHNKDNKKPSKPTGPCWFCLSSPDVEKHLIVSVGDHSYLALAKGGLVDGHLMVMPIEHYQSSSHLGEECLQEMSRFKDAVKTMFSCEGEQVVSFERNFATQHLQLQMVPLGHDVAAATKETFMNTAEHFSLNLDELPPHALMSQVAPPGTPFFLLELPSGQKYYHRIRKGFPMQFAREVLCSPPLLNASERIDWRQCKQDNGQETAIRDKIREKFKPYDFTLDDGDDDDGGDSDE